jgi:hypothetical protein
MGAALTYARRYVLFTLAGIAGEDDLDAPGLNALEPAAEVRNTKQPSNGQRRPNRQQRHLAPMRLADRAGAPSSSSANPALKGRLSAVLRDQLRNQISDIDSAEAAAFWARRVLPAKNSLGAADARQLEDAFHAKLEELNNGPSDKEVSSLAYSMTSAMCPSDVRQRPRSVKTSAGEPIDKSELAHPEPRRIRDREHIRFIANQPCLVCGRLPSDPHHLRFAQYPALGRNVSDEFTVPLCRGHHREVHRCGHESAWWQKTGIDPTVSARLLWLKTHPLPEQSERVSVVGVAAEAAADSLVGGDDANPSSAAHGPIDKANPIPPPAPR